MATMKQKTRRIMFTATTVGMLAFGGIMAEKAYSSSIQAQQENIKPAAVGRAQTIKEQLDPRNWDYQKRKTVGLSVGMFLVALFLLVKSIRDTEIEMKAEREKNKPIS